MMEGSNSESQVGKEKDLLQQALDLSAIGEEECVVAQEDQPHASNHFVSGVGCNFGDKIPESSKSKDLLQTRNVSQTRITERPSEKFEKKNNVVEGSAASDDKRDVTASVDDHASKPNPYVENIEKKVNLVIPKIPSVVVRNENNDIIEQMNEPESFSKPGNSSASVRQTLKSKIMEKSKSLEMNEAMEHKDTVNVPQTTTSAMSDEMKGLSNIASNHTHIRNIEKTGHEISESSGSVGRKNEKIDLHQVSVSMPSIATINQPGSGKLDAVGQAVSTMQHYIAPEQGSQVNSHQMQPGLVPMDQGGAFFPPGMVPYTQRIMMTRVTQQMTLMTHQPQLVQQSTNNTPSTRMPGMPLVGMPNALHINEGKNVQVNSALGQFQGSSTMQHVIPGFVPLRFSPYPQHFLPHQAGAGPVTQNSPRPIVQQAANPVGSTIPMLSSSNIVPQCNQGVQHNTMKGNDKSTDGINVQHAEIKSSSNTKDSSKEITNAGTNNSSSAELAQVSVSSESANSTQSESTDGTHCTVPSHSHVPIQSNLSTHSAVSSVRTATPAATVTTSSSSGKDASESEFTKPFELENGKFKNDSMEDVKLVYNRICDSPVLNQFSFYKCDKCSYKTKLRHNFRMHYSLHLSYKPYSCKYCKFRTYAQSHVNNHMKVHSNQDPSGFYYFPDSALDKAIEFHCDDCKEVKWVNDAELARLKKEILFVPKCPQRSRKMMKKDNKQDIKESESGHKKQSNLKRKADVLESNEALEVKIKKKPGRKPKAKIVAEEAPMKLKEEEGEIKDTKEDSETEEDEEVSSKKIPNYEIVDPTNILETPKRKRKFKTLFDPSPELHSQKKFSPQDISDDAEKFTPAVKKSSKHKCPYCSYKSDSPIGIRRHAFWRHKSFAYCCDNCSFRAKSAEEVLVHCEKEHPKMHPFVKKTFDRKFDKDVEKEEGDEQEKEEPKEEKESEEKEEKYKEEFSENQSVEKDKSEKEENAQDGKDENKTVMRPLRKVKVETLKDKSLFQCTQCSYTSNALGVQSHMLKRHNICQYFCGVCDFESDNEAVVMEHFKKEHPTNDLAISRGFAKLKTSDNKTDMAKKKPKKTCPIRTLKRAKDTVRFKPTKIQGPKRDSPAECPICGFKSRYSGVQRHISMIHGLLKWQCGKCGIQLFSKGETIEHSLTVHDTHAPCVIRSFFEVEKVKELKDINSLIIEKNGKVKIGAPGEGMVVGNTPKHTHVEPSSPTKNKKEDIIKDTQCPECSFSSNVKGVQRHLMLIHKICRWQCKICGFGSLDKHVTLEHSVDMHEGMDSKIVRAFVDIDRYNAEKRLNASDEQELQNQSANKQSYLFDFDETSSNENYDEEAMETTQNVVAEEKSEVKALSPLTSLKSKEEKTLVKTPEQQLKKLSKLISASPTVALLDDPIYSPAEVAKKRTKTPPRGMPLDVPSTNATGDSENEMPSKKKRGRPKGSGTAAKGTVAVSKKECSNAFVLKPKELNCLQQGFSCVYCVYAAPLRHQVRLHCYDKHTNHPACLMEFKVDTQCFRSDGVIDMVRDSPDKDDRSKGQGKTGHTQEEFDGNLKEKSSGKSISHAEVMDVDQPVIKTPKRGMDVQQNGNSVEENSKKEELKEGVTGTDNEKACLENGLISGKEISEGKTDSFDSASTHSNQDMEVDELQISEIFDNGKRFKSSRKQRKKFDNPLKTLVNRLHTGRINLEDPFHGTLDEVDSILFQFGVRTLNMDMLTQQQFSNFISKFGADLQPA